MVEFPTVSEPMVAVLAKRFVEDAVVAKSAVAVALVVVKEGSTSVAPLFTNVPERIPPADTFKTVVVAVPKYATPEVVNAVVDAYGKVFAPAAVEVMVPVKFPVPAVSAPI
jgi:hypothetical protein